MQRKEKIMDVICFLAGPALFAFGFFGGFRHSERELFRDGLAFKRIFYPFPDEIFLMAVGVCLVCFGFLRKYWEKKGGE